MSISFNEIPTNSRVPGVYVEYDNANAIQGLTDQPYKLLLIGQKTDAGAQDPLVPVTISSIKAAETAFGAGSILHSMARAYFATTSIISAQFVAFDDPGSAVAATGEINFGGTATAAGTLSLYVGGDKVSIAVASGDTDDEVAAAMNAAINAATKLPITSEVDGSDDTIINLTAKNAGLLGNDIDLRFNYAAGDETPAGITHAITALASGAGAPDFDDLWAALGDTHYNVMALPYNDATSLTNVEAELLDRSGPVRQIESVAITAKRGTVSAMQTLGDSRNSQFVVIVGTGKSPTPGFSSAAEIAKLVTLKASNDPARPIQNQLLSYTLAPALTERLTAEERNTLLFDGVATIKIGAGDKVYTERMVTSYQENASGDDDTSYLDVETLFTLSFIRYDIRTYFSNKYPDHKLANDDTRFGAGQKILTPKVAKAECLTRFALWEEKGLVEDVSQFKTDLVVERDSENPNRLNILLPVNLVNQLRQVAIQIGFRI